MTINLYQLYDVLKNSNWDVSVVINGEFYSIIPGETVVFKNKETLFEFAEVMVKTEQEA